jgi:hypothetical protein
MLQFAATGFLLYLLGVVGVSYLRLTRLELGFDIERTLVFRPPPWAGVERDVARLRSAFDLHNTRVRSSVHSLGAMPEVISAAVVQGAPFGVGLSSERVTIDRFDGRVLSDVTAGINHVGRGFVSAIGAKLLAGHGLDVPTSSGAAVALVNEALAEQLSSGLVGGSPPLAFPVLGRELRTGPLRATVVGVIGNIIGSDLMNEADPQVFFLNTDDAGQSVVMRLRTASQTEWASVKRRLEDIWGGLDAHRLRSFEPERQSGVSEQRSAATLLGMVVMCSLPIAGIGVIGALVRSVSAQQHQIAVRSALGAGSFRTASAVVLSSVRAAIVGGACGTGAALVAAGLLQSLLFGVEVVDVVVVVSVTTSLLCLACVFAAWPALLATRVEPSVLLKANVSSIQ